MWFTPYFYFVLFKFFKCGFQTLNWFHDPLMSLSSRFEQLLQTRVGPPLLWPTVRALIRQQRHSWCRWTQAWLTELRGPGSDKQSPPGLDAELASGLAASPCPRPAVGCWAGHCSSLSPLPPSLGVGQGGHRLSGLSRLGLPVSPQALSTLFWVWGRA